METRRILYDFGPILENFVGMDMFNPINLRGTAVLDHVVDGRLLKQAWDRTKRVYPIIEGVIGSTQGAHLELYGDPEFREGHQGDHFYLVEPEGGTNDPIESVRPIKPGCDLVGGRVVCVSYHDNEVSMSAYHALVDGYGFNKIMGTMLYAYLALRMGHEDARPIVELREERPQGAYYVEKTPELLRSLDYAPVPRFTLPDDCRGFWDDDMRNDDSHIYSGGMEIDAAGFMGLCKAHGANPSSMLGALCARAVYALNPDETRGLAFEFTISEKLVLGLTDSIADAIGVAYAGVTREDVERGSLAEIAQRIRRDVDVQRSRDYVVSMGLMRDDEDDGQQLTTRIITYFGPVSIGDNDCHIQHMWFQTNGNSNLYMAQVNDKFCLTLMYGRATEKYLGALRQILRELGVPCEIARHAHATALDSLEVVK